MHLCPQESILIKEIILGKGQFQAKLLADSKTADCNFCISLHRVLFSILLQIFLSE